jgi:hypothetical protein
MYDIASALRRRAAAERLQALQRADRTGQRAADTAGPAEAELPSDASEPADVRTPASPAATIADLLRGGGSPLFFERRN